MTEREILERAAKAAGIDGEWRRFSGFRFLRPGSVFAFDFFGRGAFFVGKERWRVREDDGEALRLAVRIPTINVSRIIMAAWQAHPDHESRMEYVRREILHAAAKEQP